MQLFLDIGNTALKWRARRASGAQGGGGAHRRDWSVQIDTLAEELGQAPASVHVASVAGREADALLAEVLASRFGVRPHFYYSPASDAGVTNSYAEPQRLGVDRWLAIVETWHRCGASVVIDCGSALTLDLVDSAGRHGGGFIVPGLKMLESSLETGTGSVRVDVPGEVSMAPGCSTSECVQRGILRMSVAFITDAVVALQNGVQDTCSVFMTGGDAAVLQPHLGFAVQVVPDLVLDGLERVCGKNQ